MTVCDSPEFLTFQIRIVQFKIRMAANLMT